MVRLLRKDYKNYNMKHILLIALLVTTLFACQNEGKKVIAHSITAANDTLTYHTDTAKSIKIFTNQERKTQDTTYAYVQFPVFDDDNVNQYLFKAIIPLVNDSTIKSYQDLTSSFVRDFNENQKEFPDMITPWFMDLNIKILNQKFNYMAVKSIKTDYTGGAHPNTFTQFLNFDPKTLKEITLDNIILSDKKQELLKIAEQIFRKDEKLSPSANYDNYFFENNKFSLPSNFYISDEGLQFLYNNYEIKAYVYGQTTLIIPFKELKNIAKPNSILSAYTDL